MHGRTRCKKHGGATPRGEDSPHWNGGNGGRGAAKRKAEKERVALDQLYHDAKRDPELLHFRHDIALFEAARRQLTRSLNPAKMISPANLKKLIELGEQLRRVKEAEHRRMVTLGLTVTAEKHRRAMALTAQIVADVVRERTAMALALIDRILAGDVKAAEEQRRALNGREWSKDMAARYRVAALRETAIVLLESETESDERGTTA